MVEQLLQFAQINPWSTVLTLLFIVDFLQCLVIFVLEITSDDSPKDNISTLVIRIVLMTLVFIGLGVIALYFTLPTITVFVENNTLFYWILILIVWGFCEFIWKYKNPYLKKKKRKKEVKDV